MITTPSVFGKPGQAPTGISCDLYPLIGSHSTWTDHRGPVSTTGNDEPRTRNSRVVGPDSPAIVERERPLGVWVDHG